jgi:hypothetical protein
MSTLSLRLPESLHRRLGEVAEEEGVSINQLINSAVGEKMSALWTERYLSARAKRGNRRRFVAALSKVPDTEPVRDDRRQATANKPLQRTGRSAALVGSARKKNRE